MAIVGVFNLHEYLWMYLPSVLVTLVEQSDSALVVSEGNSLFSAAYFI